MSVGPEHTVNPALLYAVAACVGIWAAIAVIYWRAWS